MKTNKLDKLFKRQLEGYKIEPSSKAVGRFHQQLGRKHRLLKQKMFYRVAVILLFGSGILWLALMHQREQTGVGSVKATVERAEFNNKSQNEDLTLNEDVVRESVNGENGLSNSETLLPEKNGKEGAMDSESKSQEYVASEANVMNGQLKRSKKNGFIKPERTLKNMAGQITGVPSPSYAEYEEPGTGTSSDNVTAKNMESKASTKRETVPIRIVYKRTAKGNEVKTSEINKAKEGFLKKGYKKVAAIVDRLNIKEGAREKLAKTRDELVAMNPVKILRKEEDK